MPTSCGVLNPPYGIVRLQVAKMVTVLVTMNMPVVNEELANLKTIGVLMVSHYLCLIIMSSQLCLYAGRSSLLIQKLGLGLLLWWSS